MSDLSGNFQIGFLYSQKPLLTYEKLELLRNYRRIPIQIFNLERLLEETFGNPCEKFTKWNYSIFAFNLYFMSNSAFIILIYILILYFEFWNFFYFNFRNEYQRWLNTNDGFQDSFFFLYIFNEFTRNSQVKIQNLK